MKSFNDGPEQECWALWLQNRLFGGAFCLFYTRHGSQPLRGKHGAGSGYPSAEQLYLPIPLP